MFKGLRGKSYDVFRLYLYQIALALFGLALALATGSNRIVEEASYSVNVLQLISSIFSVLFYLFLVYTAMWDVGQKDRHSIERGDEGASYLTGLGIGLLGGALNFLLAIFITLGSSLSSNGFFSKLGAVGTTIALLIEGMYTGILAVHVDGAPLNTYPLMWFLIVLPQIAVSAVAYNAGARNHRFIPTNQSKE